ncbi:hypothetical protein KCV87_25335 [Actinosynnema pretiosum subsp. pretiosum]|uniref:Uncharacterized protein n=1 Tax=Actinosynnema pretiosum subsp. pretiosum TaxID=103721 RepID=A0AA45L442_9PSEU|nr:hypothetical protein [Actinosynnema mirum]AXX33440.1 hypothetical protein APASM_6075 [Actinosynnema pretiosum subsp. pretiosum]QUF02753.1 hypothetical protein KCV87_25335 [Actinosynnema pretiosum subsp. pretiosum]
MDHQTESAAQGVAYRSRELLPKELDAYTAAGGYDLRFLIRDIGYPEDPVCVSHHPGALAAHQDAGRLVLLRHRSGPADFAGGYNAGVVHARAALIDARTQGYPEHLPLLFTCEARPRGGPVDYLRGAAAVLGAERTWLAGQRDVVHLAQDEGAAGGFLLLDGGDPREGIALSRRPDGHIYPGRVRADLIDCHVPLSVFDRGTVLEQLAARLDLSREGVHEALLHARAGARACA